MEYMPPSSTTTLSCRAEGTQVCFSVVDTGIGIGERDLPYIFDRFYKANEARSRQVGGTGLGLPIARWIIERHGGEIRVSSTPDHGTEFHILISR